MLSRHGAGPVSTLESGPLLLAPDRDISQKTRGLFEFWRLQTFGVNFRNKTTADLVVDSNEYSQPGNNFRQRDEEEQEVPGVPAGGAGPLNPQPLTLNLEP